ncbi:MAG: AraC family transcriptional regulator [Eisenbergiella massiliensis]
MSDVAEKCEIQGYLLFSRVFKKYTGTTPGAYSRKYGLSGKKMPLARNMSVPRE